jgi:polyvinyl alcohol dehydrogenase (cytochrome)
VKRYVISAASGLFCALVLAVLTQHPSAQTPAAARTQTPAAAQAQPAGRGPAPNGAALYEANCAQCHTGATDPRIPTVAQLRQRSPQAIVDALTTGQMRAQGESLSPAERQAIAQFLGAASQTAESASPVVPAGGVEVQCSAPLSLDLAADGRWNGWGVDVTNTRFQPANQARLTVADIPNLKLKWAFGFQNGTAARAQPTIAGGRVFVGSQSGEVRALDAKTGCTFWNFKAAAGVRTAIVLGPSAGGAGTVAYFGDTRATAYAIDASNGTLIWSKKLDNHRSASITGSPTLYENRLYVPVASGEEGQGNNPQYECCTFRGSVAALDIANGNVIWQTYSIAEEPKPTGKNKAGTTSYGPAGAGIWSAPTVDVKRRMIYAATGNMYSGPQQPTSDSVLAFDMDTGKLMWHVQATPEDIFMVGCNQPTAPNCPENVGPDFDFGNAPILARLPNGKDAIVIGQKSGMGWAFDPDNKGAVLWQYKAGRGSALGGMEWGSAVDSENAYFAIADGGAPTGGLYAVSLANGERVWFAPPPASPACGARGRGCTTALSAAITVIPGVVFAGSMDGAIRAYSAKDGSIMWEFDTNREFQTVNGVKASGASINQAGPTVAGGMVFVSSGYGSLGGRPGNVLLAFGR